MTRSTVTVSLLVAILCGLCASGWAQTANAVAPSASTAAGTPSAEPVNTKQLVMDVLTVRLARELALNDEQTVVMAKRFTDYRAKLESLKKERQEQVKALRASISAAEPDAQIEAKLKALSKQDTKITEYKKNLYDSASEGLSIAQRARLYVFLSDFENDMRKLIQKAREQSRQRANKANGQPAPDSAPPAGQPSRSTRGRIVPLPPASPTPPATAPAAEAAKK